MDNADDWIEMSNCGAFICTGMYNYHLADLDGTLLGNKKLSINNTTIDTLTQGAIYYT